MLRYLQGALRRFGYQLVRDTRPPASLGAFGNDPASVPAALESTLRADHPRLLELKQRYAAVALPMAQHTWWTPDYIQSSLDLRLFRGDNVYVWQKRHLGESVQQRYYLYARDVQERDALGLLGTLREDGAFGCWVYRYRRFPALSRDLLDSVNELNFLERQARISAMPGLTILDIGAGYGRLAQRSSEALPNLGAYWCVDAIAESTFLSEVYLRHRGCTKATVVPLDELARLDGVRPQLAVNVHSFSEMSLAAIEGWLDLVARLGIPRLFIVPNDGEALLSMEGDGTRRDFAAAIAQRGYRLAACEPVIADADVRELVGVQDYFFLYQR